MDKYEASTKTEDSDNKAPRYRKLFVKVEPKATSVDMIVKQSPESYGQDTSEQIDTKFGIVRPKRRFRTEWMSRFPWLKNKKGKAYCSVCQKSIANMLSNIERHDKQKYHIRHMSELQDAVSDDQCDQYSSNLDSDVAEIIVSQSGKKHVADAKDSQQIFADYLADQMRNMSEPKQRRLKLLITKAIIEVEEGPDDMNIVSMAPVASNTQHISQIISEQPQDKNIFVQLSSPEANMWREYFVINSEKNGNTCLIESNDSTCGKDIKDEHITLQFCDDDPLESLNAHGRNRGYRAIQRRGMKRESASASWKGKRKFRSEWIRKFHWLKNENGSAYCTICSKSMANMLSNLERHDKQQNHQTLLLQQVNEKSEFLSDDNGI